MIAKNCSCSGKISYKAQFLFQKIYTVVEPLLKHSKIDVNREDAKGLSPLMEASRLGYNKVVEALLVHPDVQVNKAAWDDGNTALIYAIVDFKKKM